MSIRSSQLRDALGRPIRYKTGDEANTSARDWNTTKCVRGISGGVLYFPVINPFERTDKFSFYCWYRSTSGGAVQTLVSEYGVATAYKGYGFRIISTNVLELFLYNNFSGGNLLSVKGTTSVTTGSWVFLAATYDGSSTVAGSKLYINAVEDAKGTTVEALTGSILPGATDYFTISNNLNTDQYLRGKIGEVGVANKELSLAEIQSIFGSTSPHKPRDPRKFDKSLSIIDHWRVGEGDEFPFVTPVIGGHYGNYYAMGGAAAIQSDTPSIP